MAQTTRRAPAITLTRRSLSAISDRQITTAVGAIRSAHSHWGKSKICAKLRAEHGDWRVSETQVKKALKAVKEAARSNDQKVAGEESDEVSSTMEGDYDSTMGREYDGCRATKRRWNKKGCRPLGVLNGRVVVALSLANDEFWQQLSNNTVSDLASYLGPVCFAPPAAIVRNGEFVNGYALCIAGDAVLVSGWQGACVGAYDDHGTLQQCIGVDAGLKAWSLVVMGELLYAITTQTRAIAVTSLAGGGARLQEFDSLCTCAVGLAAYGGHLYVTDGTQNRVVALGGDGSLLRHTATEEARLRCPIGLCVDGDRLYVASQADGRVAVFRLPDLSFEKHVGTGILQEPMFVCATGGLLFVTDARSRGVTVIDLSTGDRATVLMGFGDYHPAGVAIREDGMLFVAGHTPNKLHWSLFAARLLMY